MFARRGTRKMRARARLMPYHTVRYSFARRWRFAAAFSLIAFADIIYYVTLLLAAVDAC